MTQAVAVPGERSFTLEDFADEIPPCRPTLEGWAAYLAGNGVPEDAFEDLTREPDERFPHKGGETYKAYVVLWQDDVIASRRADESWTLSRPVPEDAFVAVRWGHGTGWCPDNIIGPDYRIDPETKEFGPAQTMNEALLAFLTAPENADCLDDTEYVAVGTHEEGWFVTFHAGPPPSCTATRSN